MDQRANTGASGAPQTGAPRQRNAAGTRAAWAPPASETLTTALSELRALTTYGQAEVAEKLRARDDPYDQVVIAALFVRGTTTAQAVAVIAEAGFGQQAMILDRVLFELMVDSYWVHANRELARQRFVEHGRFKLHLQRQTIKRYPEAFPGAGEGEELPEADIDALGAIFGRYGHRSWTGLTLHERVEAIQEQFPEGVQRRNLWFAHQLLNDVNNAEVHPSSWSLGRIVRRVPDPGGGERVQLRVEPEYELAPDAVRQAWWLYGELLDLVTREFDLASGPLVQLFDQAAASFDLTTPETEAE